MLDTGIFIFKVWIVPFWFWGTYRPNIAFPKNLEIFFYRLWYEMFLLGVILLTFGLCYFTISSFIRRDSLKELGIRFDNIWESERGCAITFSIIAFMIIFFYIFYCDKIYFHSFTYCFTVILKYSMGGNSAIPVAKCYLNKIS
jgi:hypothetical protein